MVNPQIYLIVITLAALGLLVFFLMRSADKQLKAVKVKSKRR